MEGKIYPLKASELMRQLQNQHYDQAKRARELGKRVAWCIGQVDTNALVAMDYIPIYPENHAAMCGARGVSLEHCLAAEARDFSPDLCSYARNDLGSIFTEGTKSPVGGLPKPDLLLAATMCNTHLKWWEELARLYQVPLLVYETPVAHDNLSSEELKVIVDYVRRQLEEHITAVEGFTGKKLNYDRFQEAVANTSKAAQLYGEIVDTAQHIPSPITSFDTFLQLAPLMVSRGFPEPVGYYQVLKAEVEERISQGVSAVGEERYRLYWDNIPIWFRVGYLARKFSAYGACFVAACYPHTWMEAFGLLNPENPLESIAYNQTTLVMNRGTGQRVDFLCYLMEKFSVEGLVMQSSRTCKPYLVDQYAIMHLTEKRTGMPAVNIEGDMVDPRLFSEAETDSRIESFMEMLARRKG